MHPLARTLAAAVALSAAPAWAATAEDVDRALALPTRQMKGRLTDIAGTPAASAAPVRALAALHLGCIVLTTENDREAADQWFRRALEADPSVSGAPLAQHGAPACDREYVAVQDQFRARLAADKLRLAREAAALEGRAAKLHPVRSPPDSGKGGATPPRDRDAEELRAQIGALRRRIAELEAVTSKINDAGPRTGPAPATTVVVAPPPPPTAGPPPAAAPPAFVASPAVTAPAERRLTPPTLVAGGVAVGLVAGGAFFGVRALGAKSAWEATTLQAEAARHSADMRFDMYAANGLYAGAAVSAGVAALLYFLQSPAEVTADAPAAEAAR